MKILYLVNEARFFLSHRLPLGLAALARGFEVVVVNAPDTGEAQLADYGFRSITVPLSRSGFVLRQEIAAYRAIKRTYREERPDLVHHVTIKPVIYGALAARAVSVPAVVNAVPGMGFVFTRRGLRGRLLQAGVNLMYRHAFASDGMRVIVQNSEDLHVFIDHGILRRAQAVLIRGSGVDLDRFTPTEEPAGPMTFVLVARMLRDKGVYEFARAAHEVRARHPDWRFQLAGDVDPGNPSSLSVAELRRLETEYGVQWLGHAADVPALLAQCHALCLPTYREGLPKTLLEASAAGRPMIASDIAGCREVIADGVTGILVPPRQVAPLTEAMLQLGEDPAMRERFGKAARSKAEAVFGIDDVVEHTFRVYDELLTA